MIPYNDSDQYSEYSSVQYNVYSECSENVCMLCSRVPHESNQNQ